PGTHKPSSHRPILPSLTPRLNPHQSTTPQTPPETPTARPGRSSAISNPQFIHQQLILPPRRRPLPPPQRPLPVAAPHMVPRQQAPPARHRIHLRPVPARSPLPHHGASPFPLSVRTRSPTVHHA